jgi:hypothetical protein
MERNFQSAGFSQHEKARFNIQKLKSWLNKRVRVRVFFETQDRRKSARGPKPKSQ